MLLSGVYRNLNTDHQLNQVLPGRTFRLAHFSLVSPFGYQERVRAVAIKDFKVFYRPDAGSIEIGGTQDQLVSITSVSIYSMEGKVLAQCTPRGRRHSSISIPLHSNRPRMVLVRIEHPGGMVSKKISLGIQNKALCLSTPSTPLQKRP